MLTCSVVIVNYNGWDLLRTCLRSLAEQTRAPDEILVVDNGSTDGSLERLAVEFPEVEVLPLGENLGFAAANNRGIAGTTGEIVVLLNNDTIAEPSLLVELLSPFECDPDLGSVAAAMVFASAPETVASAGIEIYRNGLALDHALGRPLHELVDAEVFGASAGAAAYRRQALDDAGPFCEPFFMYLEDVDLAWRLRLRGWRSRLAPRAVVRHAYSASSLEGSAFKRRLLARNRLWQLARCAPRAMLARHAARIAWYDALAFGFALVRRDWPAASGRLMAIGELRIRIQERSAIQARATVGWEEIEPWLRADPTPGEMLGLRHLVAERAVGLRRDNG